MTVALAFDEHGAGRPLVILHGLYGSKRNWATIAGELAGRFRVLCVDLRNHGTSPWHERHDYPALAADVAELIRTVAGGPAAVLGHSMGGKAAMLLALTEPALVERLVVVDIAPARSPGTAAIDPRVLAAVPLEACPRRADVEAALAGQVPAAAVRSFLVKNLASGPEGLVWKVNLAALRRHYADILGFPDVPPGRVFAGPTLFVAGGRSGYVQPEHHAAIRELFPAAAIEVIPEAGHWVHAEAPREFLAVVGRFLDAAAPPHPMPG